MRTFLPSRLDLKHHDRSIQLQFMGNGFELRLFERGHAVCKALKVSAAQLKQVGIDLRPVEIAQLKLLYLDRHVVLELDNKVWAKAPDVEFMRLLDLAVQGTGAGIDLSKPS